MKTNTQILIMRKIAVTFVVSNLAISAILCAPSQQQSAAASSAPVSSSQITSNNGANSLAATKTISTPKSSASSSPGAAGQLASAASVSSGSPSFANLPYGTSSGSPSSSNVQDEMDTFDGKNPFSDDSLWQIPIHLTRDQSVAETGNEQMAKSASEMSNNDEDGDGDEPNYLPVPASLPQSSSSSPTIISASTDLKTAAGYHYPTHGGHHGYGPSHGHHEAGHHGGHYGGGDHYGKYFQYASVPYPYAWDFGYRRGNPYHTIERYEHGKGPHFQTKVKWSDKHGGYGVHVWDYNHDDHHSHHYGGHHHESHEPSHYGGHHASHGHYGGH